MSIARRTAAPWVAAIILVTVLIGPATWQPAARATDPTVNDAITQQQLMAANLTRQRAQLAELQRQQSNLTASIRGLNDDIASVGLEIGVALEHLQQVTRALEMARGELWLREQDIKSLASNLQNVASQIQNAQTDLAGREALLQDHLRTAYEQSQTSILEVLISTDSFTKATSELSYMLSLSDEDQRLAAEVRDRANWLEVRRKTLSLGTETLAGLRDAAAREAAALGVQQRQVDAARQALQKKQAQLAQMRDAREAQFVTNALSASETQLMIAAQEKLLEGQSVLVARLKVEANALDIAYRGRFEWPEHGNFIITQEFGRTQYETFHTGLDMAYLTPRCGGLIYAAGDGVVLEDGRPLAQWGDSAIGVVIGHSQRLATYYWHLSGEIVTVGQVLHAGDVIGYEGMTGWATGCHLHFAVLLDGVPHNPREYLP
ncbi:MAG: peptidoglycan DD-metalloendopeptidase family protein [Chloroflexota bacterium]|nr:peptidoglycan DD-metalloendopeptidase family protein [Chloroflexota bacterium]